MSGKKVGGAIAAALAVKPRPKASPEGVLALLDGLSDRGLLARLESVDCDGVSLKFAPAPTPLPPPEIPKPRERDDEDEHGLKYASA